MLSSNGQTIENAVLATLPNDPRPTEAEVRERALSFRTIFPIADDEFDALIRGLHAQLTITMDVGTSITSDHVPWLHMKKATITPFYWERYRKLLVTRLKWPPPVVNTLDRVADDILDLAGDPNRAGTWARKGLIVGDVQSGKTATYTALCCKAADADYRLVILLTGTIESLRRQTHERLDEGFVGRDSFEFLQKKSAIRKNIKIGVGQLDGRHFATVFTSRSSDFSIRAARSLGFSLQNSAEPILMVCKKNPRILENLRTWLEIFNASNDGTIKTPLLLIDDEADSASINTNALTADATRTNSEIRKLLQLFERSSYIGVTATPFANVFIHPNTDKDMLGDDLFPSDFIYSLEAPANYLGPAAIFAGEAGSFLRHFDDIEGYIPAAHKVDFAVGLLPQSLIDALYSFILATTVRDLRGEGATHRSMLVNVSRFTRVQEQVAALLDGELRDIQREIRLYAGLPESDAIAGSARLSAIRDYWKRDVDSGEFTWLRVQHALNSATQPIVVKAVNQRTGASSLDYKLNSDAGLRVVAVGGNSLSRGLTLEGLSTSYFYRNSKMYDTLLQMGRWFGYRGGYADLCRLWLTEDAASWFTHITRASAELRAEFKRMNNFGMRPREFGLKVRAHPDSLIVTARNKMRTARDFVHHVSLSRQGLETVRLRSSHATNLANYNSAVRLIDTINASGLSKGASARGWHFWGGVPKALIAAFLSEFQSDVLNFSFQIDAVSDFIALSQEPKLQLWDVAIVTTSRGEASPVTFAGLTVRPISRHLVELHDTGTLLVSGTNARVGPGGAESEGIDREQVAAIRNSYKDSSVPDLAYRAVRKRPLLLLYLVRGSTKKSGSEDPIPFRPDAEPLVAVGLSFPDFEDSDATKRAAYKINIIEWNSRFQAELEPDDDVPADDDDVD